MKENQKEKEEKEKKKAQAAQKRDDKFQKQVEKSLQKMMGRR